MNIHGGFPSIWEILWMIFIGIVTLPLTLWKWLRNKFKR